MNFSKHYFFNLIVFKQVLHNIPTCNSLPLLESLKWHKCHFEFCIIFNKPVSTSEAYEMTNLLLLQKTMKLNKYIP